MSRKRSSGRRKPWAGASLPRRASSSAPKTFSASTTWSSRSRRRIPTSSPSASSVRRGTSSSTATSRSAVERWSRRRAKSLSRPKTGPSSERSPPRRARSSRSKVRSFSWIRTWAPSSSSSIGQCCRRPKAWPSARSSGYSPSSWPWAPSAASSCPPA
jgi:hypothetical protein